MKELIANYRGKEVKIILNETDGGVVVNITGECTINYNDKRLINNQEEGILKEIPESILEWVKENMDYVEDNCIEFKNLFTLYIENDIFKIRHWMFNVDLMKENDIDEKDIKNVELELGLMKQLFTDKIKLVHSHNSDFIDDYMDIQFKEDDFDADRIDLIMEKWSEINKKYGYLLD